MIGAPTALNRPPSEVKSMKQIIFLLIATVLIGVSAVSQVPLSQTPTWTTQQTGVYSTGMVWRDINNDGYIDVFFSRGNDIVRASNTFYLSQYGVLPSSPNWSSGNVEYSGHAVGGDINDDGFVDFFASNYLGPLRFGDPNRSDLYLNTGGGLPSLPSWYTGDWMFSFTPAFGDVDNDGDLDLALATGDGYEPVYEPDRVYFNNNGVFDALPGWQSSFNTAALDVTWGDVDNDGDLDLALCYDNYPTAVYYNSGGTLETTPSWQASINEPANTLVFGDVNGDGWLDLVVAHNNQLGGGGYFRAYFNNGAGVLNTSAGWLSATGGYGSGLALYDHDNDGDQDLATGRWFEQPKIYENISGTFTTSPVWQTNLSSVTEEMVWIDSDGDGVELRADTITTGLSKKLFYTRMNPLYAIDSVVADGTPLGHGDYCFDLIYGWVSLKNAAASELRIHYKYSYTNDLAISNWDTVNMVYGNTATPYVDFSANVTSGWAPLAVSFTGNTSGASNWLYGFGDGGTSSMANPQHTYTDGGAYDVYAENVSADGWHNRTRRKMIRVLADTMRIADAAGQPGQSVTIQVSLRNTHPLQRIILPLSLSGDFGLGYSGFNVVGCRTDYFQQVKLTSFAFDKLVFLFQVGSPPAKQPLAPGDGPIINIEFLIPAVATGLVTIDSTTLNADSLHIEAGYFGYQPHVIAGTISTGVCGDMNGSSTVDIADLTYLVAYMFKGGPEPASLALANVNGQGEVDIADLTFLVAYMFKSGPAPVCN